jgi:hypothetical protein
MNHSVVDLVNQQQHQNQQIETKNSFNYPNGTTTITTANWLIEPNDFNSNNNNNNKIMVLNNHATSFCTDQLINNDSYNFYSTNMNRYI